MPLPALMFSPYAMFVADIAADAVIRRYFRHAVAVAAAMLRCCCRLMPRRHVAAMICRCWRRAPLLLPMFTPLLLMPLPPAPC